MQLQPRRSFIFSPGLRPDMFPKALASGADIVCVELEDGIAPKDKEQARHSALALFETPQADDGVERIVRINCLREAFGLADVQAVLATNTPPPALNEVFTPSPDEIARAERITQAFVEADTGLVVIDGKLIEKPVLREMYRILAIADRVAV